MPNFHEFMNTAKSRGTSDVKVNDILKAQAKGGVEANDESVKDGRIKDVAEMFISAEKQVETDMKTFGNADAVKELGALNKNFTEYANNLAMMKFYLSKFSDTNAEVSAEDAAKLQQLVKQNEKLVSVINDQRKNDKTFNDKMLEKERALEFNFRSQGIMSVEQEKLQRKYSLSNSKLWKGIGDDVDQLKDRVKDDMKNGLIEGIGGPLGTLTKKVLLPGLKAAKESALGKSLGPKLDKLGTKFKAGFLKGVDVPSEVPALGVPQSEDDGQKALNEGLTELEVTKELPKMEASNEEMVTALEDLVDETKKPSTQRVKREVLLTDKAEKQVQGTTDKDANSEEIDEVVVLAKGQSKRQAILEETANKQSSDLVAGVATSNVLLQDIVNELKTQKGILSESYDTLATISVVNDKLAELNESELVSLVNSATEQEKFVKELKEGNDFSEKRTILSERLGNDIIAYNKEVNTEANDDRDANTAVDVKVLKELEELNTKDFGGGGIIDSIMSLIGGGGIMAALGFGGSASAAGAAGGVSTAASGAAAVALPAAAIAGAGYVAYKNVQNLKEDPRGTGFGIAKNWYERQGFLTEDEKAAKAEADQKLVQSDNTQMLADFEAVSKMSGDERAQYFAEQGKKFTPKQSGSITNVKDYTGDKKYLSNITAQVKAGMTDADLTELIKSQGKKDIQYGDNVVDWRMSTAEKVKAMKDMKAGKSSKKTVVDVKKGDVTIEKVDNYENKDEGSSVVGQIKDIFSGQPNVEEKTARARAALSTIDVSADAGMSDVDKQVQSVQREADAVKAEGASKQNSGSTSQQPKVSLSRGGGSGGSVKKKQNLDNVSILPEDNFGLILVNSGVCIQ